MSVYQRRYEFYVVQPFEYEEVISATSGVATDTDVIVGESERLIGYNTYAKSRTTYDDSLLITDPIQLEGEVKYKRGGSDNSSSFTLYNLSDETLSRIKADYTVLLKAGYQTDKELPILFVGSILKVSTEQTKQGRKTKLICKEGGVQQKDLHYNNFYQMGLFTYSDILLDISSFLQDNGVSVNFDTTPTEQQKSPDQNRIAVAPVNAPYPAKPAPTYYKQRYSTVIKGSYNLSGNVFQSLSVLCDAIDYVWYMSKGVLYIQPRENPRLVDYFELSPAVILGSVSPSNDNTKVSSNDSEAQKGVGVSVSMFLDARVALENYFNILEGDYAGSYRPEEIEHKLNWFNGPWQTKVKCKPAEDIALNQTVGG